MNEHIPISLIERPDGSYRSPYNPFGPEYSGYVEAEKDRYVTGDMDIDQFEEHIERALVLDEDIEVLDGSANTNTNTSEESITLFQYRFKFTGFTEHSEYMILSARSQREAEIIAEEKRHPAVLMEYAGRVTTP